MKKLTLITIAILSMLAAHAQAGILRATDIYASDTVYTDNVSLQDYGNISWATASIKPGLLLGAYETIDIGNGVVITRFGDIANASAPTPIIYADCVLTGNCIGTFQILPPGWAGSPSPAMILLEDTAASLSLGGSGISASFELKDSDNKEFLEIKGQGLGSNTIKLGKGGSEATATVSINGSFDVTGDSVVDKLTASGDVSASGNIFIGGDVASIGENNIRNAGLDSQYMLGTALSSQEEYIITIGRGANSFASPLVNNVKNSIFMGMYSDIPTLMIGPSAGVGTTGKVGIGTSVPTAKLTVNGDISSLGSVYASDSVYINDAGALYIGVQVGITCSAVTNNSGATFSLSFYKGMLTGCIGPGCTCP